MIYEECVKDNILYCFYCGVDMNLIVDDEYSTDHEDSSTDHEDSSTDDDEPSSHSEPKYQNDQTYNHH